MRFFNIENRLSLSAHFTSSNLRSDSRVGRIRKKVFPSSFMNDIPKGIFQISSNFGWLRYQSEKRKRTDLTCSIQMETKRKKNRKKSAMLLPISEAASASSDRKERKRRNAHKIVWGKILVLIKKVLLPNIFRHSLSNVFGNTFIAKSQHRGISNLARPTKKKNICKNIGQVFPVPS